MSAFGWISGYSEGLGKGYAVFFQGIQVGRSDIRITVTTQILPMVAGRNDAYNVGLVHVE